MVDVLKYIPIVLADQGSPEKSVSPEQVIAAIQTVIVGNLLTLGLIEVAQVIQGNTRTGQAAFKAQQQVELDDVCITLADIESECCIGRPVIHFPEC